MKLNIPVDKIIADKSAANKTKLEQFGQIVLDDNNHYVPRDQDDLMKSGSVQVQDNEHATVGWYSVYARFQHEGKVMVGRETRSAWAKSGETKVVTNKDLNYSTDKNPNATSHWTEVAKKANKDKWMRQAQKLFGGK